MDADRRGRLLTAVVLLILALVTTGAGVGAVSAQPAGGSSVPTSCEAVQADPSGNGPDYRVVSGSCTITLSDGEVLSNVWFKASGDAIEIRARGSGWTIRNVAITNSDQADDSLIYAQINARDGVGLVHNLYVEDTSANAIFVNAGHSGKMIVRNSTFLNIGEDALYASPPGNLHGVTWGKEPGQGGTVHVRGSYAKNIGTSGEQGYGFRFGSDGSSLIDSAIVGADVAVANLFAVGSGGSMKPGVSAGVTIRNVDISKSGLAIRLGSHQDPLQPKIDRGTITRVENVDVGGSVSVNLDAELRGSVGQNPSTAPPPGSPRSAERAATGVGGGTGSIGSAITGEGGEGEGSGNGGIVGVVVALLILFFAALAAFVVFVTGLTLTGAFAALKPP